MLSFFLLNSLVMRITTGSNKAEYNLEAKFGCNPLTEAPALLKLAKQLDLNVVGIHFHVGSCCKDYDAFNQSIEISREVFNVAKAIGFDLKLLDIGGGFVGDSFSRIDEFSSSVNDSLDKYFPSDEFPELKVIAEPGRYFVASAFTLAVSIHSRKVSGFADGKIRDVMYYTNEGIYSNFFYSIVGKEIFEPEMLKENQSSDKFKSILWGEKPNH